MGTLFDLEEPEHSADSDDGAVWKLAPNLDLLFPKSGQNVEEKSRRFLQYITEHTERLLGTYRILLVDLPAGGGDEENLNLLPHLGHLVVVTNPEPTAHVSAGGYLHMVMERDPSRQVYIWHNKFSLDRTGEFNPRDVVGNYHRNTDREAWLPDSFRQQIHDIAFVPADPSLNLLLADNPSPMGIVYHSTRQSVLHILDGWLDAESCPLNEMKKKLPLPIVKLVRGCISRRPESIEAGPEFSEIAAYINAVTESKRDIGDDPVFISALSEASARFASSPLWREGTRALSLLAEMAEASSRMFNTGGSHTKTQLENTLVKLMYTVAAQPELPRLCKNSAGMLLFQFGAGKLLNVDKVKSLILSLVPHRKGPKGRQVRDRRLQIRRIVEQDASYRKQYLKLLKISYPLFTRQIDMIVKTFELGPLLFRDEDGRIYKQAYVTMLSQLIHDILYSGMGIVVGFSYRAATDSFAAGAEILFEKSAEA